MLVERTGPDGGTTTVLVDTSPDLREQLLRAGVDRLDAIVLTHSHADHTHGMDDVRPLVIHLGRRIGLYMDAPTAKIVLRSFSYIFETPQGSMYPPLLDDHRLEAHRPLVFDGAGGSIEMVPFTLHHGEIDALGLRIGDLAYTPDVKSIPDSAVPYLSGLQTWIIDALRYAPHPSHLSLSEALAWLDRLTPRSAVLTNLHTDLDYDRLCAETPANVTAAYDGMRIEMP